jgi:hypothetical protein
MPATYTIEPMKQRQRGNGKPVQVLGLRDAMGERLAFVENLNMLRKKYGPVAVAKSLGLHYITVWRYYRGKSDPNVVILLSVNTWAEREKQLSAELAS